MPTNTISYAKIYSLILFINFLLIPLRIFFFPNEGFVFHFFLFAGTFVIIIILWEIILVVGKFLDRLLPVGQRPEIRIGVQVLITFGISFLLGSLLFLSIASYSIEIPESLLKIAAPLIEFLITIILNLVYFTAHYFQEWKVNFIRSESLQREQAEMRYNTLRSQLNPHFLFNALTSLNSLIFENQQLASDFLKQLSKVYRYTLQHKNSESVSLKTEIEFIRHYIFLLETRFAKAVHFTINIEEQEFDRGIVPVTTQMLIENVVKHNIISLTNPLQISIATQNSFLVVSNTVNKKKQVETSNKQGLESLCSLYQYLSPAPIEVSETVNLFTVKIPLI